MIKVLLYFLVLCILPVYLIEVTSKDEYLKELMQSTREKYADKYTDESAKKAEPVNFLDFYYEGVGYYTDGDWENCIAYLEKALALYHAYYNKVTYCRIKCENERSRYTPMQPENFENTHFFEGLVVKTLCLEQCRIENLEPHITRHFYMVPHEKEIFSKRKPYQFLQFCYYREGEVQKAVSASFTASVADPDDELNKKTFEYYNEMVEFDADQVVDLEDKQFSSFYHDGLDSYDAKDWKNTIKHLETSLKFWLNEDAKCRAFCDSSYNQQWLPDITTSTANHYIYTVRCKQNCVDEMKRSKGKIIKNILENHFNYLQLAYYNVDNLEEACKAVGTFMFLDPNDDTMKSNYEFYKKQSECTEDSFKPRKEIVDYVNKYMYEKALLHYVDEEFTKMYDLQERAKDVFAKGLEIDLEKIQEAADSQKNAKGDSGDDVPVKVEEDEIPPEARENEIDTDEATTDQPDLKKRAKFESIDKVFSNDD